jgi:hypothetical protein
MRMSHQTAELAELVNDLVGADGYHATLENGADGHLKVAIAAGPDACADCLVPKSVMRLVLLDRLPEGLVLEEADIVYPNDAGDH